MTITVLLVDDHPVVRTGLRALFANSDAVTVVGEAATGEEAIALAEHLHPQVVLCDLRLGAGIDGVETTARLRAQTPAPAVIILTTFDHDVEILRAVEAGAAGYLLKDVSAATILSSLTEAAAGGMVLAPEMARRVVDGMRQPQPKLTAREHEVLQLLGTGASNREIAKALFVTEATVKTHLVHLFGKLGVESRAKAVTLARETGLISPFDSRDS
ncbi:MULTISPECIES: response regulator transcription factor [unclassified Leucobacter]|uniref:response regulator n=1 Tax=unclassified Leucobacter TaxID=2621730 RepID=UPI00165E44C3|nr:MULTISPECIES: response regulator transcription factor [unclassified Leucobacter]MBC9927811.1 response regulator transcription factor [Leucobacter sp. cx-169]MBC9936194.1 response regulator transcription factor [Leucobacter sp. cx-87]